MLCAVLLKSGDEERVERLAVCGCALAVPRLQAARHADGLRWFLVAVGHQKPGRMLCSKSRRACSACTPASVTVSLPSSSLTRPLRIASLTAPMPTLKSPWLGRRAAGTDFAQPGLAATISATARYFRPMLARSPPAVLRRDGSTTSGEIRSEGGQPGRTSRSRGWPPRSRPRQDTSGRCWPDLPRRCCGVTALQRRGRSGQHRPEVSCRDRK